MNTFRRLLFVITTALLIVVSIQPAAAQAKKTLTVPGLQKEVEVLRDSMGINHIYAANTHDLFFAQGYCAAKDRPFQFELWRRQATGTVADMLGPNELTRDIGTRLCRFRGNLQKELAHYHPQGVLIINAYVEGVNAFIDELLLAPNQLPQEFVLLGIKPQKWTADIVVSRHQGLLGNIVDELNIGRAVAAAGADKVADLMWFHPKQPYLRMDPSITTQTLSKDILRLYNAFHKPVSFQKDGSAPSVSFTGNPIPEQGVDGSNNWIISGRKTASGAPFLANDPHRAIALPSLRYMVHLVAPGWNVMGAGEPVIPGVSIGHNEYGAWGLTIYETDGEDLYVYDLNPDNLKQYRYKNAWVTMEQVTDTITVKGASPVRAVLQYTLHGPVTYIDSANRKAYAVKCAWLEPGGAPYLASLRINQSKNWNDFRTAAAYSHIPGENMIWADRKGDIGWQVVGITPIRKNFSGMVPVPGDGRYEWDGYLDIKKRPHELNPKKGFLATANQNVTPSTYSYWNTVGYTWADPYRGNRINEVLMADNSITLEETKALQTDYFSIPARTLVPMLSVVPLKNETLRMVRKQLEGWNFILDKSSVAAGIYAMWERKIYTEANKRFLPSVFQGLIRLQLQKIITWLQLPGDRFGMPAAQKRDEFLAATFEQAVTELEAKLGNSVAGWTYGQTAYKHTTIS
ncbi:MAG: penicillin acylase family protein, partial [Chitinophagaceae bacterium]